jgi:hypothetical protein
MATSLWSPDKGTILNTALPNDTAVTFGSGGLTMRGDGNLAIYASATATNPGGTGGDYVLYSFTLPANSLDASTRGVNIVASGSFANNTNAKRVKILWGCATAVVGSLVSGGTIIADTGSYSTTGAVGWSVEANVFNTSTANTQVGIHVAAQMGATVASLLAPVSLSATTSSAIIIAVTGNATTTASDIGFNWAEIFGMN